MSDDEISLLSLSDDDGAPAKPAAGGAPRRESSEAKDLLEQATLWAEVDTDELERIAVNIAQNAVIQTENNEAVSRLNITASAIESDNMDPLGFGRIDTRVLALSRNDSAGALGKGKSGGRASVMDASRRASTAGRRSQSPGPEEGSEVASTQLRSKVLPASEQFDPELYLRIIHADTPLQQLMTGLHNLKLQLSEHTGQMKALVKENFERFISSKNTIDDIYSKLQKAESEGEMGADGTSSSEVMAAVLQVQDEARRAFGSLLERQAKAERIKQVLGVIRRYEAVVRLPSAVREHAEARDYEQVVAGYSKAKALLADHTSELPQQAQQDSMWLKLLEEIDKVVSGVCVALETVLRSPSSGAGEALEAVKTLLHLQAVGCKAAQGIQPIKLYIESQERAVMGTMEGQQQRYKERMGALQRQRQETEDREAQLATLASMGIAPPPSADTAAPAGAGAAASKLGTASAEATARHVARLAAALAQWLPPFWNLTQVKLPGLASIGDSTPSIEAGMAEAEAAVGRVIAAFRHAVRQALGSPQGLDTAGHLGVLRELVGCCLAVQAAAPAEGPAPCAAMEALRGLVEQAAKQCLAQLKVELEGSAGRLCQAEDWVLDPASLRAGTPVTGTMTALARLVGGGMQALQSTLQEAARVQVNPLRKSAAPAREAFFGCFSAFGVGLQKLAAAAGEEGPSAKPPVGRGNSPPSPPPHGRRLLLLCANAIGARTQLLPSLYRTWASVLLAGGLAKEGQAAAAACAEELEKVEGALVMAYIDRKQAVLDDVMEEFFFGGGTAWEVAPPPTGLRPVVMELIHALVQVQAELASSTPTVLVEVVAELVTSLVEGFCEVVGGEGGLHPGITPGGVCQLWLEARYLAAAVGGLSWQALREALAALDHALAQRLQRALAGAPPRSEMAAQLAAWCSSSGSGGGRGAAPQRGPAAVVSGAGLVQACAARVRALSEAEAAASAANLLPLRLLGGATVQKA